MHRVMVKDVGKQIGQRPPNVEIEAEAQGFFVRQANEIHRVVSPEDSSAVQTAWRCFQKGTFQALSGRPSQETRDITPSCRATSWQFPMQGGQGRLTLFTELDPQTKTPKDTGHLKVQATFDHPVLGYLNFESTREEELHHFTPLLRGIQVFG